MKTRTLLLLAVACGLVILVAGSLKLFLVADADPPAHLALGAATTIGDMTVTAESVRHEGDVVLVTVVLMGVDDPDGATDWVYATGEAQLQPVAVPAGMGAACQDTAKTSPTTCVLAFDTAATQGVLVYSRAGEARRWDVVASN